MLFLEFVSECGAIISIAILIYSNGIDILIKTSNSFRLKALEIFEISCFFACSLLKRGEDVVMYVQFVNHNYGLGLKAH